ncbi:HK97 gp10 family phage protein [Glaciibacter superstes]|uniref:HK97 gp10 family phage protein n=1 Tax=Glaciibacter superstes TaxID=501023 RepID=UPI00146B5971|nr:HK97 gp10 family phage protein [Glaciibacter superstes]
MQSIVKAKAEQVAAAARASAPVDTGDYRDSIHVEVVHTPFRVVAKVVADSDHAMLVESKHGTLSRALRAAGNG